MSYSFTKLDALLYIGALPLFILLIGSLLLMLQAVFKSVSNLKAVGFVSFLIAITSLLASFIPSIEPGAIFLRGSYTTDGIAKLGQTLICFLSLGALLITYASSVYREKFFKGDTLAIYFMSVAGMLIMISTNEMMTAFIGLEMASIGIYTLVGYVDPTRRSQEGSIKYLVIGSLGAGVLLFGFSLLYAASGSLFFPDIAKKLVAIGNDNTTAAINFWTEVALLMIISGLGIKLSLVPFHMWAPDAYESAPTPITLLMATAIKVMLLCFALRISLDFSPLLMKNYWTPMFAAVAILSVIVANLMALVQGSIKRMLAYSSIAHSGYMAFALCALSGDGAQLAPSALMLYVTGYSIISLGVFAIICWLESEHAQNLHLDDFNGLATTHPKTSVALSILMFALAGLPPASGFITKLFVFQAAISSQLYALAIAGAIGSSIALFYYLRVIVRIFMTEKQHHGAPFNQKFSPIIVSLSSIAIVITLLIGTWAPRYALEISQKLLDRSTEQKPKLIQRTSPCTAKTDFLDLPCKIEG